MEIVNIRYTEKNPAKGVVRIVNNLLSPENCPPPISKTKIDERSGISNALENFPLLKQNIIQSSFTSTSNPATDFTSARGPLKSPQTELVVLDIKKLCKDESIDLTHLSSANASNSFLILNSNIKIINHIILKYDGSECSVKSIKTFSKLFPDTARKTRYSSMISPVSFRKNQVLLERRFVKKITPLFGELGFIKLPLKTINDFVEYALRTKGNLIILPRTDLPNLIKYLRSENFKNSRNHPISFFVG